MSEAGPGGSLGARTAKGAGWLIAWRLISRVLGIVNTVVLVRLLLPSDFGLVASATSLSFAVDGLSYIGVQDALVRERVLDRTLYDTGFTLNLARGGLTALTALVDEVAYLVVTFRRVGLRARDLALNVWRPTLATGGTALALLTIGLTQPSVGPGLGWSGLLWAATALIAALVVGAVVLLAWLASGRPAERRGNPSFVDRRSGDPSAARAMTAQSFGSPMSVPVRHGNGMPGERDAG